MIQIPERYNVMHDVIVSSNIRIDVNDQFMVPIGHENDTVEFGRFVQFVNVEGGVPGDDNIPRRHVCFVDEIGNLAVVICPFVAPGL